MKAAQYTVVFAGDQLAIFGEALRELTERATFLYKEGGRYWFSTQQTLNRLAADLAKGFAVHDVDEAIATVLREDASSRGGFHRVGWVPPPARVRTRASDGQRRRQDARRIWAPDRRGDRGPDWIGPE